MLGNQGLDGYQTGLNRKCVTIAEALSGNGYHTYMSGKWHVTTHTSPEGPKDNWPLQRGFEKFYGTIIGAGSFYDPNTLCRQNTYITPVNDPHYQPESYYYTDAITDNAISFLAEHEQSKTEKPFFLYVSYTAAHWPMHALPEDIQKYQGSYDDGYEMTGCSATKDLSAWGSFIQQPNSVHLRATGGKSNTGHGKSVAWKSMQR